MRIELTDTNAAGIAAEFIRARIRAGCPVMGMVMTLVIVVDEDGAADAMEAAKEASHEHPARVLGVILGDGRGAGVVNAQVGTGGGWAGETALIRLSGEVAKHPSRWCCRCCCPTPPSPSGGRRDPPDDPAADPLGALGRAPDHRRGRSAPGASQGAARPVRGLLARATPTWPGPGSPRGARCSPRPSTSTRSRVRGLGERGADQPQRRPAGRLAGRPAQGRVTRPTRDGPGITAVVLETKEGDIRIDRPDGRLATFTSPGQPDRPVALKRKQLPELLAEELRRPRRGRRVRRRGPAPWSSGPRRERARRVRRALRRRAPRLADDGGHATLATLRRGPGRAAGPPDRADRRHHRRRPAPAAGGSSRPARAWTGRAWSSGGATSASWRPTSADRNALQARAALLDTVGVDPATCTRCPRPPMPRPSRPARRRTPRPCVSTAAGAFDVLMLGIGPDGHVRLAVPRPPRARRRRPRRRRGHRLPQAAARADHA